MKSIYDSIREEDVERAKELKRAENERPEK